MKLTGKKALITGGNSAAYTVADQSGKELPQ